MHIYIYIYILICVRMYIKIHNYSYNDIAIGGTIGYRAQGRAGKEDHFQRNFLGSSLRYSH